MKDRFGEERGTLNQSLAAGVVGKQSPGAGAQARLDHVAGREPGIGSQPHGTALAGETKIAERFVPHLLDDLKRQLALCSDSHDALELTPMLLLGPPGVGKTHFAREVAQLLGTGMGFISMSSMTAGWVLSGASSQWKGARAGKVFETLVDGQYANPVMVVDEIDKGGGEHAYDPLGSLYSLLEHDTAGSFTDEFAEVPIDASQVIWVATANDLRGIPDPILNRMNVFDIEMPDEAAARQIASKLYRSIRADHDWGQRFDPELSDAVLGALGRMAPREMRRALMTAFGNAKLDGRYTLEARDLPDAGAKKSSIGFVQ